MTDDNVLILGNGYLANRFKEETGWETSMYRVTTLERLTKLLSRKRPWAVVNCIGHVGQGNVDECEQDRDKTLFSNAFVPYIVAEACRKIDAKMVNLSTGCMYDRPHEVTEETPPNFDGLLYSRTKMYSDLGLTNMAQECGANILNLRFRVPVDNRPAPKNLIDKLQRYGKVLDGKQSVTWIPDLIDAAEHLMRLDATGTYNVATDGPIAYVTLMEACRQHDPSISYKVISDLPDLVRTRVDLNVDKLKEEGFQPMTPEALYEVGVNEYYERKDR